MNFNENFLTILESKLDIIKLYSDTVTETECGVWTSILTFNPRLRNFLANNIYPSIKITGLDNITNNTLEEVMSNTSSALKCNYTYDDNSIIITGSGDLDYIMFGCLIPTNIFNMKVKAKCQSEIYEYTFPVLDISQPDALSQLISLAYPIFRKNR